MKKVLGKTLGKNLDVAKLGFTMVFKHPDFKYEIWHKKSICRIGEIIQIWKSDSSIGLASIDKDGELTHVIKSVYCDYQSQLKFIVTNTSQFSYHLYPNGNCTSCGSADSMVSIGDHDAEISWGRKLNDGSYENMITHKGGEVIFKHPEYDEWNKKSSENRKQLAKIRKQELKEWLKTPPKPITRDLY